MSTELDAVMTALGATNTAVAAHLGVTEKTVREWRASRDDSKTIPFWAVLELPDALRREMLKVGDGFAMADRIGRGTARSGRW